MFYRKKYEKLLVENTKLRTEIEIMKKAQALSREHGREYVPIENTEGTMFIPLEEKNKIDEEWEKKGRE